MATRSVSPGGTLLRASRLFSIPTPIPKPATEIASAVLFNSDTATLPHPTHLAITTPPSSLGRGDWGLKRPLPLGPTTKSSTPLIRIKAIDTYEHITDYQSAADHTLTLKKWQETNMSLSMPGTRADSASRFDSRKIPGGNTFEEVLTPDRTGRIPAKVEDLRWRFDGPWLARLTVGEFNQYVRKEIGSRKDEFWAFLKENKARADTEAAQTEAREKGEKRPRPLSAEDISDDQLRMYVQSLRRHTAILFKLIGSFLDLPPPPAPSGFIAESIVNFIESMSEPEKTPSVRAEDYLPTSNSPYSETGPPKTHPSAGLSYLRANNYIYNHPVYGPQERPPPIEGRVIMPKISEKRNYIPKVGIAGIVADVPAGDNYNTVQTIKSKHMPFSKQLNPGLANIEPDKVGGSKLWLHPERATIDSNGQINLKLVSGDGPALAIHQGKEVESENVDTQRIKPIRPLRKPTSGERQRYGLESRGIFDKREGRSGQSDPPMSTEDAAMRLRSLFEGNDEQ